MLPLFLCYYYLSLWIEHLMSINHTLFIVIDCLSLWTMHKKSNHNIEKVYWNINIPAPVNAEKCSLIPWAARDHFGRTLPSLRWRPPDGQPRGIWPPPEPAEGNRGAPVTVRGHWSGFTMLSEALTARWEHSYALKLQTIGWGSGKTREKSKHRD